MHTAVEKHRNLTKRFAKFSQAEHGFTTVPFHTLTYTHTYGIGSIGISTKFPSVASIDFGLVMPAFDPQTEITKMMTGFCDTLRGTLGYRALETCDVTGAYSLIWPMFGVPTCVNFLLVGDLLFGDDIMERFSHNDSSRDPCSAYEVQRVDFRVENKL